MILENKNKEREKKKINIPISLITGEEQEESHLIRNDIKAIIRKMTSNRTPGSDNITTDMLKYRWKVLAEQIYKIIKHICIKAEIPEE